MNFMQRAYSLSQEQLEELRAIFNYMDTDKDKHLSSSQALRAWRLLGILPSNETLDQLVESTLGVNFHQFVEVVSDSLSDRSMEAQLTMAFRLLDQENKGAVSVQALEKFLIEMGDKIDTHIIRDLVEAMSQDDDVVNLPDFVQFIRQHGEGYFY
eukprot:gnl/Trimastix_PCT/1039.p1 GENE.gnl/Trimastix_PCT/1039~~gnl/Trimastix_PCT/1039.p1  ORF type:complete len:155 (-),score=24.63 gnl/Trimastix_PCT/1039:84-548(-)